MKLDVNKIKVLLVWGGSDLGFTVSPILDGLALPLNEQVHSLGVLLDPCLLMDKQVAAVVRSAF